MSTSESSISTLGFSFLGLGLEVHFQVRLNPGAASPLPTCSLSPSLPLVIALGAPRQILPLESVEEGSKGRRFLQRAPFSPFQPIPAKPKVNLHRRKTTLRRRDRPGVFVCRQHPRALTLGLAISDHCWQHLCPFTVVHTVFFYFFHPFFSLSLPPFFFSLSLSFSFFCFLFLSSTRFAMRLRISVRGRVCPSVRPSVCPVSFSNDECVHFWG